MAPTRFPENIKTLDTMKITEETKILEVPTVATDSNGIMLMTARLGSGMPAQTEVAIIRLRPDDGRFLTQTAEVDIADRIVTDGEIQLGRDDCAGNWREIDATEAEALLAEQARELEAREAATLAELNAPEGRHRG